MKNDGQGFKTVRKPQEVPASKEAEAERRELEKERSAHGRDQITRSLVGYGI